jgi:hypothetical protein
MAMQRSYARTSRADRHSEATAILHFHTAKKIAPSGRIDGNDSTSF